MNNMNYEELRKYLKNIKYSDISYLLKGTQPEVRDIISDVLETDYDDDISVETGITESINNYIDNYLFGYLYHECWEIIKEIKRRGGSN